MQEQDSRSGVVKVLIVDDSRSIRTLIRALLSKSPRINVVGEATDPFEARSMIRELAPDVITLDVEMPGMDGLDFLERIMRLRPMPVVMVSSRTKANSEAAIRALSLGAIECVDVTRILGADGQHDDLVTTVLTAADSKPRVHRKQESSVAAPDFSWNGKVVVMGASTGGVDALDTVLSNYPAKGPPTVIVQHMAAPFLKSFTERLDRFVRPRVLAAADGLELQPGLVCVAPGGGAQIVLAHDDPTRLRSVMRPGRADRIPSIDVLFSSAVAHGRDVVGVLLTGMGSDGAEALARMRRAGAHTIVQDAATSVVDGMPKAARKRGAATEVAPLNEIGARIMAQVSRGRNSRT